ncbi:MAG: 8-oxoguanine deaminase [Candidatus Marinimicrobia bacterium]|nr:8-oxoguanine deaminase [Candidatus Neomarinimicrobiota bacterium]
MSTILIKNPLLCCRIKENVRDDNVLDTFSGGHILIEDNLIVSVGPEEYAGKVDRIIDACRMVVLPGLVNTHHHFFQTLTRNIFSTQKSELFDWLTTNYEIWKGIDGESFYLSAKIAIAELLKSGCTTTSDHLYLFPENTESTVIDREIIAAKEMGIRFQPTRGSMSLSQKDGGLPPDSVTQTENDIFADIERLLELYHDDSFGSMLKISLAPCSPFSVTEKSMRQTADFAKKRNLQIHTHLAETKDEENFCLKKTGKRPFDYMESLNWIHENAWFAHSIFLNDDEIKRAGQARIGISHCPSSNMRLGSGICRVRALLDAGVNVSLAVDGSASNDSSNMLLELRNALLLSRLLVPQDWLNTEEILWMATKGGANALGRHDIGQILPGKCADIIMVNMDRIEYSGAQHDPAAALIFNVLMGPIDFSIINGKLVVENGKINGLDEKTLIRDHQLVSTSLVNKAEQKSSRKLER